MGERDVPDIVMRCAEVSDKVGTGALGVPGQLINARKPARDELRSAAVRREFPEIGMRTVVATLLLGQVLVQRVKHPFTIGREGNWHSRRLPVLRKAFDRLEHAALQVEPRETVRRALPAEATEKALAVRMEVQLALCPHGGGQLAG